MYWVAQLQLAECKLSAPYHWFKLSLDCAFAHEASSNQGSPSSGAVGRQHEVKLVVNAHQLADARLHDVGEVRMESGAKNWKQFYHSEAFGIIITTN